MVLMMYCEFQKQEHPLHTTKDRCLLSISLWHKEVLMRPVLCYLCYNTVSFQVPLLTLFFLLYQNIQFTMVAIFK